MGTKFANSAWASTVFDIEGDADFVGKVTTLFNQIWALEGKPEREIDPVTKHVNEGKELQANKLGQRFLKDLEAAGKTISIKKGAIMLCKAPGASHYKLITAWAQGNSVDARKFLQQALDRSPYKIDTLARQLATPGPALSNYAFTPKQLEALVKTYGSAKSPIGVLSPTALFNQQKTMASLVTDAVAQWVAALTNFLGGSNFTFGDSQRIAIARRLEPWLEPGAGSPATVEVNLNSSETTCSLDGTKKKRPLAIGFVHELIHAYYAVTGTRLYGEASIQDEALTTGLPPEHFRTYSENRFRSVWSDEVLDLRLYYAWGDAANKQYNLCPYCGHRNPVDERSEKKDTQGKTIWEAVKNCKKCGLRVFTSKELDLTGVKLPDAEL